MRALARALAGVAAAAVAAAGCAGPGAGRPRPRDLSQELRTPELVAVVAARGDTLASLAADYLGDARRDWVIAEFNGVGAVRPGDELAIPLAPFKPGGLSPGSYQTVPVLSYHKFAETSGDRMTVTAAAFEAQMRLLRDGGYRVVGLDDLLAFAALKADLPEKAVVITIDDGWRSTYDVAFPILRRYGYPATLFVYTQLVTGSSKTLSWEQIREMAAAGIDIQAHTVTHRNLAARKDGEGLEAYLDDVERELLESARVLEEKAGLRPRYLAYPYGETSPLVIALARRAGYRGAFTVERGANAFFVPDFRLQRSMIYGDYDLARFERNLKVSDGRALR